VKTEKNKSNRMETAALYLLVAACILFAIKCISAAMIQPFSFDGAIFAQVAQNLSEKAAYAVNYDLFSAAGMTIGITVSLPVALMFKIAGQGFTQGLLVNALYMILFMVSVTYYLKKCLNISNYLVLFWLVLFAGTPGLFDTGFGLYGEVPMLFFMISALIFFHGYEETGDSRKLFFAGLLWGFGLLTKTVFLIMLPGLIFVMLWAMAAGRKAFIPGKNYFKGVLNLAAGFLAGPAVFEIYKFLIYGFLQHLTNWKGYIFGFAAQSGVIKIERGLQDTFGFFSKINKHLDLLGSYTGFGKAGVVFLLCLILAVFISLLVQAFYSAKKKKDTEGAAFSASSILLMAIALSYFAWWIFITPTARAWHRRIFDGILLYEAAFVIMLNYIYSVFKTAAKKSKTAWGRYLPVSAAVVLMLLFFGAAAGLVKSGNHEISFIDNTEKKALQDAGSFIKTLPREADLFGFNWWQAPNASFASGRKFKNLFTSEEMKTTGSKQAKYLVLDREAIKSESICYVKLLSDYENTLVFENSEVRVYQLKNRLRVAAYDECQ
jgi:hypothetical protein